MAKRAKINMLTLAVILVVAVVVAVALWVSNDQPESEVEITTQPEPQSEPKELPPLPETPRDLASEFELKGELPPLDDSDSLVKSHMRLVAGEEPVEWLTGEQVLQRVVIQVANMAEGELAYRQSPLEKPGSLKVEESGEGSYRIDPASYSRYEPYVDFLMQMEPELMVAFYRYYEPLLDQAYAELGNPVGAFRRELLAAIDLVLEAPVVEDQVELVKPEVNYEFADPELESLPPLHKQLIRMGPDNTRRIKVLLDDFRERIAP